MNITYRSTTYEDADDLVLIRIAAMRESLEQVGRFDPQRARHRFLSSFKPEDTKYVLADGTTVGFLVVRYGHTKIVLDHLYIKPEHQNKGIGTSVLQNLFARADSLSLPILVTALIESSSNQFYRSQGFIQVDESEWDLHYMRRPGFTG